MMTLRNVLSLTALGAVVVLPSSTRATDSSAAPAQASKPFAEVAASRAQKIVDALAMPDATQAAQVRSAVAEHYEKLHALHEARDKEIAGIRGDAALDATAKTAATDRVRRETEIGVRDLHYAFFAELSVTLSPEQVEKVKDGLTYGVLPLTYRVYCEMLPSLTAEQKSQILAWLTEAREHAVDGGSSEEKHGWFGKYKGRINNYLAKAGYDMKKAEHELQEKHKAARNAPAN